MKVVHSIRDKYEAKLDSYKTLKQMMEEKIPNLIKETWHFDGRIKTLDSFAQKCETGRFTEENIFFDLYACRIVVDNINEISILKKLIESQFVLIQSLPPSSSTHKSPSDFPFDDLRLYCKWTEEPKSSDEYIIQDLVFEIQIKTYLQHAWSLSTHSLIYKGDGFDWKLHRVAYQIKAILEHAELSIGNAEELAKTDFLPNYNKQFKKYGRIGKILEKYWDRDLLPKDITRLIQSIDILLLTINMNLNEYKQLLDKGSDSHKKILIKNLSPYYATIQLMIEYEEDLFLELYNHDRYKLYLPKEIEVTKSLQERMDQ